MAEPMRNPAIKAGETISNRQLRLTSLPAKTWSILRADETVADKLAKASGFSRLPEMLEFETAETRSIYRLGPDEYWICCEDGWNESKIRQSSKGEFVAVTDISHRIAAIEVTGAAAAETLAGGCPLDLHPSRTPQKTVTRTILGKAEIVLIRTTDESFTLLTNRSFAPYLWRFLTECACEHGALA